MREITYNGEFGNIILVYVKGLLYSIHETKHEVTAYESHFDLIFIFVHQCPNLLNKGALIRGSFLSCKADVEKKDKVTAH